MTFRTIAAAAAALALVTACSKGPETAAEDHADHAADTATALPRTPAPAGAQVFIVSPKDGETVTSPVTVVFGISGMGLVPAGEQNDTAGHHHLLIDTDLANPAIPIPADARHVHFGQAQTETTVELAPGEHTLQLVLGDYLHIPFDPVIESPKITITVN